MTYKDLEKLIRRRNRKMRLKQTLEVLKDMATLTFMLAFGALLLFILASL